MVAVAVGLLIIATRQRLAGLAVWAVVFGLTGSLESFFLLSNRLYDLGIEPPEWMQPSNLIIGTLGLALLAGGLLARRREQVAT
jgi:MYXO-CTERM domain-containing protein